jgi:hypothetical protein
MTTPANHLPPNWRQRLLAVVGAPITSENQRFLDAWQRAEGGAARFNPLNTTFPLPGALNYNQTGVRNYLRATDGVCATALTLVDGNYGGLLAALQTGKLTAAQIVDQHQDEIRTWGTDPNLIRKLLAA